MLQLQAVSTVALAVTFLGERPGRRRMAGMAVALAGIFMALMDAYGLLLVSVQVWGALWGFLSLAFIVGGLHRTATIIGEVKHLGERHVTYGVLTRHYEAVGAALGWLGDELPGEPVLLGTQSANTASVRLAARLGFTEVERFEEYGAEQWFGVWSPASG